MAYSPNTVSSSKEVRLIRVEESAAGAVGAREQSTVVRGHRRHRNQDAALFIFDNVCLVCFSNHSQWGHQCALLRLGNYDTRMQY